jgi:hypothetical protein
LLVLSAVGTRGADGATGSRDAQAGPFDLTVRRWLCPLDFASESYSSCLQSPLPGGVFFLDPLDGGEPRVGMTAPDGTLTIWDLAAGTYQLAVLPYGDAHDPPRAFCGPGADEATTSPPRLAREAFAVALSDDVVCEWYELPVSDLPSDAITGVPVYVWRCDSDPGGIGIAMAEYPDGCGGLPDVTIAVETEDGSRSATCMTSPAGGCDMSDFSGEHVILTIDTSTLPDGLVPVANPVRVWFYTEFASAFLIVIPEGAPTSLDALREPGGYAMWPRLELYAAVCPTTGGGQVPGDACLAQPGSGYRFEVWQPTNPGTLDPLGGFPGTTDGGGLGSGLVSFNTFGYGEGLLRLVGAAPRDEIGRYEVPTIACSKSSNGDATRIPIAAVAVPAEPGTIVGVYDVPFAPGDAIHCDWFFLPRE